MPHIPVPDRVAPHLVAIADVRPTTAEELTYCVYQLAVDWATDHARWSEKAEVLKAFESAKYEFYRLHLAKHEDLAIRRNTEVVANIHRQASSGGVTVGVTGGPPGPDEENPF